MVGRCVRVIQTSISPRAASISMRRCIKVWVADGDSLARASRARPPSDATVRGEEVG
jgi:hypothetical protein